MSQQARLDGLARLASCPSSPDGEWRSAAVKYFELHRRQGTCPATGQNDIGRIVAEAESFWRTRPEAPTRRRAKQAVWMPTAAEGNDRYPGMDIAHIAVLDPAEALRLAGLKSARGGKKS